MPVTTEPPLPQLKLAEHCIQPNWPAPPGVRALTTTRQCGVSVGPWAALNLGSHVADNPTHVAANRALLQQAVQAAGATSSAIHYLEQVHGTAVAKLDEPAPLSTADAVLSRKLGKVCLVQTADCLPVLFCNRQATVVAAAHAGWRGLQAGVLESSIAAMHCPPGELMAWLGPAISQNAFEVGAEVRAAFVAEDAEAASCFKPSLEDAAQEAGAAKKYLADLYGLARLRLQAAGLPLSAIYGGDYCTHADAKRFYSYRRDGAHTGRMATLIWLEKEADQPHI